MDANKLSKLREMNYTIPATCGRCKFGKFVQGSAWGACMKNQYQHLKHTGDARQLSIHTGGRCNDIEIDPTKTADLAKFMEFLK